MCAPVLLGHGDPLTAHGLIQLTHRIGNNNLTHDQVFRTQPKGTIKDGARGRKKSTVRLESITQGRASGGEGGRRVEGGMSAWGNAEAAFEQRPSGRRSDVSLLVSVTDELRMSTPESGHDTSPLVFKFIIVGATAV